MSFLGPRSGYGFSYNGTAGTSSSWRGRILISMLCIHSRKRTQRACIKYSLACPTGYIFTPHRHQGSFVFFLLCSNMTGQAK